MRSDFARKVLVGADGKLLVPEDELSAWAGRLSSQLYGRGEILFRQGDPGECCYVVLSGKLTRAVALRGLAATKGAREAIEKAGGSLA